MSRDTRKLKIKCPESANLKACLDVLQAERIWAMRMNRGAMQSGKRVVQFGVDGMADILAMPKVAHRIPVNLVALTVAASCHSAEFDHPQGDISIAVLRPVWIETKSDTGRQRDTQKSFQQWVESHGHVYLLIRNIDELREWLKKNKES